MTKLWKIGTNINSYVEEWEKWCTEGFSSFKVKHQSSDRKSILFIFNGSVEEKFSKAKASQMIRVLISLGLIESNMQFPKDVTMISEIPAYNIILKNESESLGDFLSVSLQESIRRSLVKSDEAIYPSEPLFVFSLMAIIFNIKEPKSKKFIERKISGTKLESIATYYKTIANIILESSSSNVLLEYSKKYIVGYSSDLQKVIDSVNGSTSNNTDQIYAPFSLENQISAKPITLGGFIQDYLTSNTEVAIPLYQRKYIWPVNTILTLLNDIKNITDNFKTHFVGNIIVQSLDIKGKRTFKIIDGQQRITSLMLILRAMFDFSKFKDYKIDFFVNSKFVSSSPASILANFKHVDGNEDFNAFKEIISGEAFSTKKKTKSLMFNNYTATLEWINNNIANEKDAKELWNKILNGITFIIIDDKVSNEYKLFEKLNTGAVPLTTLELFKNYILDIFSGEKISESKAQEKFEDKIVSKFNKRTIKKDIDDFITAYLRMKNSVITDETLFNQFKDTIFNEYIQNNPSADLDDILDEIEEDIDMFNLIKTYDKYNVKSKKNWVYSIADFLYMLDGRLAYGPIIMRVLKYNINIKNQPTLQEINKIREYLRVIEIFEVRLQVAKYRGQSLSGKIEKILLDFDESTTPSGLWDMFNDNGSSSTGMATLDNFANTLSQQPIANKPAKLLMTRIENYFVLPNHWEVSKDPSFRGLFKDKSQREHLMPNAWVNNWEKHLERVTGLKDDALEIQVQKTMNLIGNAFPIPAWSNNEINDSSYKEKIKNITNKEYIKDSVLLKGNEKVPAVTSDFGPKEIIDRSEKISVLAKEIWKDYK